MDHHQLEQPSDDESVEITDLNQDGERDSSGAPRRFMANWLLSTKRRRRGAFLVAACLGLALLIVLIAQTPISGLFPGAPSLYAPPVSSITPLTYTFGLDANPPWGTLSVDGKRVTPRGTDRLLSLQRGQHTLLWQAAPFAPQQCHLFVPLRYRGDTCQFSNAVPQSGSDIMATIRFPTNLSALPAAQRSALLQAVQAVLDDRQSVDTVQAGQMFAQTLETAAHNTHSCTVLSNAAICLAVTHQPLEAVLSLQLVGGSNPNAPCANGVCDSGNQNCRLLCDLPAYSTSPAALPSTVWPVSVPVQLLWQFSDSHGQIVEKNQANSFILGQQNAFGIFLNITWHNGKWNVSLTTPDQQNPYFSSNNPVCQAAISDMYTLLFGANAPNTDLQMFPGPTYASGCVIGVPLRAVLPGTPTLPSLTSLTPPTSTPTSSGSAYVMQRFGVLLAVNAAAHRLWPFLPVADTSTQRIAQQLIAQSGK